MALVGWETKEPAARLLHSPKCLTLLSYIVAARQDLPGLFVASHARHERVARELPGVVAAVVAAALPRWPLPPADNQTREEIEKKKEDGTCVAAGSTIANSFQPSPHGHSGHCAYLIFLLNAFHLLPFPSCDPYLIIEAPTSRKPEQMSRLPRRKCTHNPWQLSGCSRFVMQSSFYLTVVGWTL